MIYATVDLKIGDFTSTCDKKVILYRGDKNVEIRFNLIGNRFVVLDSTYAQLIIKRPSATSLFSEPALIQNDTVVLTISEDMIDEMKEIGEYTFQIRLYDTDMVARATLPPCESCLIIERPIAVENESLINYALINDSIIMPADATDEEIFNEENHYNKTTWLDGDTITDVRMNKIEEALYYISKNGGGGGGATAPYISTELSENVLVGIGENFDLHLDFASPNMGKGTLKVFINDVESMSLRIDQGETTTTMPGELFTKGTNRVVVYVLDRVGVMSNSLTFYVRYGSTEVVSDFDQYSGYDYGTTVRYYFTPTALDTSLTLTFYMSIDGEVQQGVACSSDTRGYYTFPTNLAPGNHHCEAYVIDSNGSKSNVLIFELIILTENVLVVASDTKEVEVEEGDQIILDYKVYMKNNTSFITKTYIDDILVNTGSCGLDFNYYRTSSLTEGDHIVKVEVWDLTETYSDYVSWNITILPSTFQILKPVNAGAVFIATAVNKSNTDERREEFIGVNQDNEEIVGTLYNFAFDSDSGWVDDELIISGNSHVEIPIQPLANNARYGFTLDIEFTSRQIGVPDAEVLTLWDDERNCGIRITSEQIILRSASGNQCDLYFTDDKRTRVMFVIDRQELKAKIYINGVMCEAFHLSDYTADGVTYLEDFTVDSNVVLGGYNKMGYAKIRNLRIYQVALTTDEIINNFISCEINKGLQKELVEFQKGNELPTLYIYCDFSGLGKDDKKPCKIVYNSTDDTKYGKSFNLDHKKSTCQYQGTSSMAYPIKNYRINPVDENGKKWKYEFPGGQPESRFTLKADFMSSGHWTNTGMAKFINDCLYHYKSDDEKSMNPFRWYRLQNGEDVSGYREAINGFPCRLILVNDGTTPLNQGQNEPTPGNTKDMGVFNFNHDKDATATLGFDSDIFPNCASYEVTANSDTSAGAFMPYKQGMPDDYEYNEADELDYIKQSFELRYPDEDDVPEGWGFMGVGEEGTGLKALIDWVDGCTDEEFVRDFEQHFHKDYTLRYYCLVVLIGAVDNLGKNMMLDTADNKIFFPRFYDIDTICSYDNSGQLKFDVDIEMEQGYWNTSSSRLWTRIRELMHDDIVATYNDMRQNGVSYERMMHYIYDEQISKIPQTYYNKDYDVKYAPFADSYIGMAHGDTYEHVTRWLTQRFRFVDSLFDYAPSYNNDVLTIRANTTEEMTIEIETYTPVYQHLSWYNGQMDKKKIDGKISVTFSGKAQAATDQEVLIYGGSNIKCIRGIKSMNPNRLLIGAATRLTELDISDCSILADVNANQANFSPHAYLTKLNISGCSQLGGNLRLNDAILLQDLDASGSAITGVIFPTRTRNLKTMKFQNCTGLTSLDFTGVNTSNVTNMGDMFYGCSKLTSLDVSSFDTSNATNMGNMFNGCGKLTSLDVSGFDTSNVTSMSAMFNGCNSLTSLDVSGFDTSNVTNMYAMFQNCTQLSSIDVSNFDTSNMTRMDYMFQNCTQLSSIDVSGFDTSNVTRMNSMFNGCNNLTSLDVSNFDTSNATDMWGMFYDCNKLTSLDVSSFDTSKVTNMGSMFRGCNKLTSLDVSSFDTSNVTNMDSMFNGCNKLTSLDVSGFDTSNATSMTNMFYDCNKLTSLDISSFDTSNVTRMNSMFNGCNSLTSLDVSNFDTSNVTNMGNMFNGCNNLTSLDVSGFDTSNATDMWGMFYDCNKLTSLDVSSFDTSNVTSMGYMFYNCSKLPSLDVSSFNTSNATNMGNMFNGCGKLPSLDVSGFDTSNATNMGDMFYNCNSLKILNANNCSIDTLTKIEKVLPTKTETSYGFIGITETTDDLTASLLSKYWKVMNGLIVASYTAIDQACAPTFNDGYSMTDQYAETVSDGLYSIILAGNEDFTSCSFNGGSAITSIDFLKVTKNVTNMDSMFSGCGQLTSLDVSSFDTSNVTNMTYMFQNCTQLSSIDVSGFDTSNATSMLGMFQNCTQLTSLDVSGFDTSNVTNMGVMFFGCGQLTSLDVSGFDTSNVTNMLGMFQNCTQLSSIDVSGFDTSNVTSIYAMFYNCSKLTSLDVSNFDTSNVTSMVSMFRGCSQLTSLDVSGFDTSNVTNMSYMFYGCTQLSSIDVSGFDTSNVTNMEYMFNGCNNLTSLDVSGFDTSNVTDMGSMFNYCNSLTSLDVSNFNTSNVTRIDYMFRGCNNLTSLDVSGFDTSNVTSMVSMFRGCSKLTSLDVSGFDTSNVTRIDYIFFGCSQLTSLDVSGFDTSNVTNMGVMFSGCTQLTSLDLSSFDTSNVTNMEYMFNGCNNLTSLDVSNFDTSNVTNMEYMFNGCNNLTSLDVSNFDTSNVINMGNMFNGCTQLSSIDVSGFDTSNATSMLGMFQNCTQLTSLDLSSFDTSKVTSMGNMFNGCNNLTSLDAPMNISTNISVSSTALDIDSLLDIINNLIVTTVVLTLTLGPTLLAKLADEQIAVAVNKGWTVT